MDSCLILMVRILLETCTDADEDYVGTIIDSTEAIVKHWHKYPASWPVHHATMTNLLTRLGNEMGVDPNVILETSHGRRSIEVLKLYDESKANWECE